MSALPTLEPGFHRFTQLPPEIRLQIWRLCLPRRISDGYWPEKYQPLFTDHEFLHEMWREGQEAAPRRPEHICECRSDLPLILNSNRPVISAVCREARNLTLGYGAMVASKRLRWAAPRLGRWYFWSLPNLSKFVYFTQPTESGDPYPYVGMENYGCDRDMLLYGWRDAFQLARDRNVPLCIDWSLIAPDQDQRLPLQSMQKDLLAQFVQLAEGAEIPCVMRVIYIHATRQAAAATNLFGRLAEEPCQDIAVDNIAMLQEYYIFWNMHITSEPRKRVARRVCWNFILNKDGYQKEVQEAQVTWKYQLLFAAWYTQRKKKSFSSDQPLANAFPTYTMSVDEEDFPNEEDHPPDYAHPWVVKTWASLPKLQPMIRFRLCPDLECLALCGRPKYKFKDLSDAERLNRSLRARQYYRFRGRGRWRWRSWAKGIWKTARRCKAPGLPYRGHWLRSKETASFDYKVNHGLTEEVHSPGSSDGSSSEGLTDTEDEEQDTQLVRKYLFSSL